MRVGRVRHRAKERLQHGHYGFETQNACASAALSLPSSSLPPRCFWPKAPIASGGSSATDSTADSTAARRRAAAARRPIGRPVGRGQGLAGLLPRQPRPWQGDGHRPRPPSLDEAIRRGLQNNLGLILQGSAEQAANGQRLEQLQSLLPTITGTASITVEQVNLRCLRGSEVPWPQPHHRPFPGGTTSAPT